MRNFDLVPTFLFRTPLLSWHLIQDFIQITDREQRETFLKNIFSDDLVREAIYIASPGMSATTDAWVRGEMKDKEKKDKLVQSLTKYLLRMGTRCTPFGLFAGVSHGKWGTESQLLNGRKEDNLRFTGLDLEYIFNVKETLLRRHPELLSYLLLYPNTALFQLSDKYKFIDYQYNGNKRKFSVSVVSHTEYLEQVLEKARNGARLSDLTALLTGFDVSVDEAEAYIRSLVEKQILVTEFEPVLTSGYYFEVLLSRLEAIDRENTLNDGLKNVLAEFQFVNRQLQALREKGPVDFNRLYEDLQFRDIAPEYSASKYFQTDMLKPAPGATLDVKIAAAIRKAAEVLNQLSVVTLDENLNSFKDKFKAKYDSKPVPLLEALDPETGITYMGASAIRDVNPLVDDLSFPPPPNSRKISSLQWSRQDSIVLAKLLDACKKGQYHIEMVEKDLAGLVSDWENLPDSINFITSLVASEKAESGLGVLILGAGLSGASNILSRFTHMDEHLEAVGRQIMAQEEAVNPDTLLLELVHLPDYTRIGNILQRSVSRGYELLFLAGTRKDRSQTIDMSDLYLCVQNNRFLLFSKKMGREVQVRLSTAHNYALDTHPVYYFLGDLQAQGMHWPLQFPWGPVERVYRFMPRVTYKVDKIDVILSPAAWLFEKEDYQHLLDARGPEKTALLHAFREKWQIPHQVTLSEYDNDILVDFDNDLCTDIFFQFLNQRTSIKLKEFLPPADAVAARDTDGCTYTNEMVALFTRKTPRRRLPVAVPSFEDTLQRDFPIGSEWLFFKFYVGTKGADDLLCGPLKAVTDELMAAGMVDKWFFIRFVDPEYHLRLRLHLTERADFSTIIRTVYEKLQRLVDNSTISKIQVDTYQREIERYGERSMELTETLFFYETAFFIPLLNMIRQSANAPNVRWMYILKSVDTLLDDFGLTLPEKSAFLKKIDVSERMGINKQAGVKYRRLEKQIDALLSGTNSDQPWPAIHTLLAQRSEAMKTVCQPIRTLREQGLLQVDFDSYLASILHMMINRICISRPNDHEYIVYDMMYRHYASKLARQKAAPANTLQT